MNQVQNIINKPLIKIGSLLGISYVFAQYIFFFGGRSVVFDKTFDSTISLLTIMGLYLGLHYYRRLNPQLGFWKLLLRGLAISAIAISLKTLFSMLLYGILVPELGANYQELLITQTETILSNMPAFPKEQYHEMSMALINSFTIPMMEGVSLFFSASIFSVFIAALLNMFRK